MGYKYSTTPQTQTDLKRNHDFFWHCLTFHNISHEIIKNCSTTRN